MNFEQIRKEYSFIEDTNIIEYIGQYINLYPKDYSTHIGWIFHVDVIRHIFDPETENIRKDMKEMYSDGIKYNNHWFNNGYMISYMENQATKIKDMNERYICDLQYNFKFNDIIKKFCNQYLVQDLHKMLIMYIEV
jgi:hypothetical protein